MRYLIFIIYTAFIILISVLAYLNIIPTKEITIPYYDYIGHFVLYGIWGYLFAIVFHKPVLKINRFIFPWGIVFVSIITIIEECLQSLSPVRTMSLGDLGCGMVGITAAMIVVNKKKVLKTD